MFCNGTSTVIADRWYQFTTLSSPATIPTTITAAMSGVADARKNLGFELYKGPSCPGTATACVNTATTNDVLTSNLDANTTYFIRVVHIGTPTVSALAASGFSICINEPPVNDDVTGAVQLTVGAGVCSSSVTSAANFSPSTGDNSCWAQPACASYSPSPSGNSKDIWFKVKVPPSGSLFIKGLASSTTNLGMAVYSSSVCATATIIGCSGGSPNGVSGTTQPMISPSLFVSPAVPGDTVYVRVWNENTTTFAAGSTFSICANDLTPCGNLPTNDFCSNPFNISTGSAIATDVAYVNTGLTYTNDSPGNLSSIGNATLCFGPSIAGSANAWYSFVATTASLSIPFTVGAAPCTSLSANVFSVSTTVNGCCKDFVKINSNSCGTNSTTANGTFTTTIPTGSLTIGNTYYLMVNTVSSPTTAACSYSIKGWSISGTLPVSLTSFTGDNEGKHNLLEWITTSEKNMLSYTLQHSADANNYENVITLPAKNDQGNTKYTAYDENPFEDVTYYRVKQLDLNGVEKYTNTISVSLKSLYDNIYNIHPNPTSNNLNFEFYSKSNSAIAIELLNYAGATVLILNQPIEEGKNNITLPMSELDNGVYILKVVSEKSGKTTHHKIIKN